MRAHRSLGGLPRRPIHHRAPAPRSILRLEYWPESDLPGMHTLGLPGGSEDVLGLDMPRANGAPQEQSAGQSPLHMLSSDAYAPSGVLCLGQPSLEDGMGGFSDDVASSIPGQLRPTGHEHDAGGLHGFGMASGMMPAGVPCYPGQGGRFGGPYPPGVCRAVLSHGACRAMPGVMWEWGSHRCNPHAGQRRYIRGCSFF